MNRRRETAIFLFNIKTVPTVRFSTVPLLNGSTAKRFGLVPIQNGSVPKVPVRFAAFLRLVKCLLSNVYGQAFGELLSVLVNR